MADTLNEAAAPEGQRIGLALSGGGSRAAAFHRGTVRGLTAVGLLPRVEVVSTVSGGSLFGGAWMASRAQGTTDDRFLEVMAEELGRGFVGRSLRPSALKMLLPGHSRTEVIADTFDRIFFKGATLGDLPESPRLCLNTTVLNHGQVGKFCREGFWSWDVLPPGSTGGPADYVKLPKFRTALAVAASAAFPVGLPPLLLKRQRDLEGAVFTGTLEGHETLALSDGGVLENLGMQTLLRGRFRTWNLVLSDAGTKEGGWKPGSLLAPVKSAAIASLSGGALDQVMSVMNNKQNRWMREATINAVDESWSAAVLRSGAQPLPAGMAEWLGSMGRLARRRLLVVRVNRTWEQMLDGLRDRGCWRLAELLAARGGSGKVPKLEDGAAVEKFLPSCGVDLEPARQVYEAMGGTKRAKELNQVVTNFTALSRKDVDDLARHAEWQVLAMHALHW